MTRGSLYWVNLGATAAPEPSKLSLPRRGRTRPAGTSDIPGRPVGASSSDPLV